MNSVYRNLTPYAGTKHTLVYNQSVGDIIQGILATHDKYKNEYDKISKSFLKDTPYKTGKAIFDFLKNNTHYVIESDNKQTLRSPSAILYLGAKPNVGLDCKSYALFIGGIIDSLNRKYKQGIRWTYRFASYKPFDKLPHHVFVVINPDTSNEIWVDPVLSSYNLHKSYHYKIDNKPMALIAMAGVGRITKSQAKQKIKQKLKSGKKLLLKFNPATTPARNAFLLLVKLNIFNIARRLYQLQKKNPARLKQFWENIGGDYRKLSIAIGVGAKQKPQFAGIGFAPAIPAAITSATPIILKIKSLLNELGIPDEKIEALGKKLLKKAANAAIDKLASKESEPDSIVNPAPPDFQPGNESATELESSSSPMDDTSNTMEGFTRYNNPRNNQYKKPQIGLYA